MPGGKAGRSERVADIQTILDNQDVDYKAYDGFFQIKCDYPAKKSKSLQFFIFRH
jgi:hypothetical protein